MNCKKYEDIEGYYWVNKTAVEYKANDTERVYFVTKGIEYEYEVILKGKLL